MLLAGGVVPGAGEFAGVPVRSRAVGSPSLGVAAVSVVLGGGKRVQAARVVASSVRFHNARKSKGMAREWIRVGSEPCLVCGRKTWCTRSADGTIAKCMRIASDKPASGDGGGWIHKTDGKPMFLETKPKPEPVEIDWTTTAQKCFEQGAAVRETLASELGVSVEALERLLVGCGHDDFRHLSYSTWPERRVGGKVVGIIRRYRVAVSDGGGNKLTMKGSKHGLYLPRDWWRGTGPVVIPEGGSDTAALLTLGLIAIGRPSNLGGVNMLIGALQDFDRPIIVLGERDRKPERVGTHKQCRPECAGCSWCWPGRSGAKLTAERLKEAMSCKRIVWRLPPAGAKDVREWVRGESSPSAGRFLNRLLTT